MHRHETAGDGRTPLTLTALLCAALLLGAAATAAAAPADPATATRFAAGTGAVDIPFESPNNLIFVRCGVNGGGPLWFVLDTGATFNAIDSRHVEALGLTRGEPTTSARTGLAYTPVVDVTVALPGVETGGLEFRSLDLSQLAAVMGRPLDGILGYDFIRRFALEIDYARLRLALHDPAAWTPAEGGERLPLAIVAKWPLVEARLSQADGATVTGRLLIDSGSLTALSLVGDELARGTVETASIGISGVGAGRIGRLAALQLGSLVLREPVAGFPPAGETARDPLTAAIADAGLGILGGQVLRRFTVSLDYTHGILVLRPNARLGEPFEEDMSGTLLLAAGEGYSEFVAFVVTPGSPAARAGLQAQDAILEIDGRPAAAWALPAVRDLFRVPGAAHRLKVRRSGEILTVDLVPERQI